MAEPTTQAPEKDIWEMSDDEIFKHADLDDPESELVETVDFGADEYPGDVAHQMATAQDAEKLIDNGLSGARRIYKDFGDDIIKWSTGTGVDPYFALALMGVETGGRKSVIYGPTLSPAGAGGIGQFMPGTWSSASKRVYGRRLDADKRFDPKVAGPVVFHYLERLDRLGFHQPHEVAAAYNAGRGRVQRFREGKIDSLPKETQKYMTAVLTVAYLIEREIVSETVLESPVETEASPSDSIEIPKSDDELLNKAMGGAVP